MTAAEWDGSATNPDATYLSDDTCYKVTQDELVSTGYQLVLGFQFDEAVFIHAVTHVAD